MDQFVFEGKQKTVLGGFIVLGLLCLVGTYFIDATPHHARFWSNLLHNTVFFTGIAFIATFILAAFTTAYAGWHTLIKRVWEAFSLFLILGLVFFLIIIAGMWTGTHDLYHWAMEGIAEAGHPNFDRILAGKSSFLNPLVYTVGTIVVLLAWYFFARNLRSISVAEDENGANDSNFTHHRKYRNWAAIFLPVAGFTSAAIIWQWTMSLDGHWYSTMYAWYSTASWFVACMALTIMLLIYLKGKGYFEHVDANHLHDLGKYLFAISIFWTYLWFSQYMLIWYSNNGEETVYFNTRQDQYPVLFYGNLLMNFILPFFVLMRNDTKRKYGTMFFTSFVVFFGHWWDFFQMVKPGALVNAQHAEHAAHGGAGHGAEHGAAHGAEHGAHAAENALHAADHGGFVAGFTLPGLLEIGIFLGFTALFLYVALYHLSKASLTPKNDPYFEESLHHHVV